MIGQMHFAMWIILASRGSREHRSQKVLGAHALNLRRHSAPMTEPEKCQRPGCIPAPAGREHRGSQDRLHQDLLNARSFEKVEDRRERKTVPLAKRDYQPFVGRRCLQLEIEGSAKAFAEREPPGPVHPPAEWRMQNELHPATFVEEPLRNDRLLRRNGAENLQALFDIGHRLLGSSAIQGALLLQPAHAGIQTGRIRSVLQKACDLNPDTSHLSRKLRRSRGRLASPKWNGRGRSMSVFHPDGTGLDATNAP